MHRPDHTAPPSVPTTVAFGGAAVVGRAPSPMDRWDTVRVPRGVIDECERTADLPVMDEEMIRAATGAPASDPLAAEPA